MRSLEQKEKKDFKWLDWQSTVIKKGDEISDWVVFQGISNKSEGGAVSADEWIKKLIVQIPIQIARGVNNQLID